MHKEEQDKRDGFLLGAEYIASISLLSRCRKLLASGGCGGVSEAIREMMGDMKKCMCLNCFNIKAIETYKVKKKLCYPI